MTDAEFERIVAETDAELVRLSQASRAKVTWRLGLDWSQDNATINARLRELWAGIRLAYVPFEGGPRNHVHTRTLDLVPAGAIWRIEPEGFGDLERTAEGWFLPTAAGWRKSA